MRDLVRTSTAGGPAILRWWGSRRRRPGRSSLSRRSGVGIGAALLVLGLAAGCTVPPPSPPLTMDEVLDGPAMAQARAAAFGLVDQQVAGFHAEGVKEVARQRFLTCREGHNDWKTHDGFRLSCEAHDLVHFGWDGDFAPGATSALAALGSVCEGSYDAGKALNAPAGDLVVAGPDYSCGGEVGVSAYFVGGRAERNLSTAEARWWDGMRWVSGPRDAALWTRWKSRHWILAADVQAVFYQDVVK